MGQKFTTHALSLIGQEAGRPVVQPDSSKIDWVRKFIALPPALGPLRSVLFYRRLVPGDLLYSPSLPHGKEIGVPLTTTLESSPLRLNSSLSLNRSCYHVIYDRSTAHKS